MQTRDSIKDVANIANPHFPNLHGVIGAIAVINGEVESALCQAEFPGIASGWSNVIVDDNALNENYVR